MEPNSKTVVRITTVDGKLYEYPGDNPRLWAVKLLISRIGNEGSPTYGYDTERVVYVEEKTLERAGLKTMSKERKDETPTETAEDLILRLLGHVGVYPVE